MSDDPLTLFDEWLDAAGRSEPNDANAMALATCGADGRIGCRMVLLKGHGAGGFDFYTNDESDKGEALASNPRAALLFHWKSLRRQVRIEGKVTRIPAEEADAYFASRGRESQLGAWASDQSRPLDARAIFEQRVADATAEFADAEVPRPPHWGGYRVVPERIEFWEDRPARLHHRRLFTRNGDGWTEGLLYP